MCKEFKESTAIQTHVNILQNIISRMATNSANCKTWGITIISAIIVLLIDKSKTEFYYIIYIPLVLFYCLDCFYLGLERFFRDQYKKFIDDLESTQFSFNNVYKLIGGGNWKDKLKYTASAAKSFSTTPFYAIFGILIILIKEIK